MANVGAAPGHYYCGVVVEVAGDQVLVQLADQADAEGSVSSVWATGTAAAAAKVTVLVQPTGRAILVRS